MKKIFNKSIRFSKFRGCVDMLFASEQDAVENFPNHKDGKVIKLVFARDESCDQHRIGFVVSDIIDMYSECIVTFIYVGRDEENRDFKLLK